MDIQRSRNGYYTVTFFNTYDLDEEEIFKQFSSVGNVCKIINNFQRVFVRFQEKAEAERALRKFGKSLELRMAFNKSGDSSIDGFSTKSKPIVKPPPLGIASIISANHTDTTMAPETPEEQKNEYYHFILANLPKNYTTKDVTALVEEVNPVYVSNIEETRVFHSKFCDIVVDSRENLSYLINKLDGFVICGEKLLAAEMKDILEWGEKSV